MKRLERYVENIKEIRKLSSLSLDDISFAEEYGDFLATNFVKIRVLAMENMDIIDKVLNPLLAPDRDLTDEEYHAMEPYIEMSEADFASRWNMSETDYAAFYRQLEQNQYFYISYDDCRKYVKRWIKENR